jgi:hypothetical protein
MYHVEIPEIGMECLVKSRTKMLLNTSGMCATKPTVSKIPQLRQSRRTNTELHREVERYRQAPMVWQLQQCAARDVRYCGADLQVEL